MERTRSGAPSAPDISRSPSGLDMVTLYYHPFCPHSRFVRLALAEMRIEPKLVEERSWERRREFLMMAAEGATPVLVEDHPPALPGAEVIAE